LVSPTEDVGKILNALHGLSISSKTKDVTAAVQVASLALKHRRNKNGSQRIVLFVGTPLDGIEVKALQKAGRQLKKNNVAIDVVALGELEANEEKLKELVDAANGRSDDGTERTCHLVTIPAGVLPSDVLASSPVVHGGSGGSAFAASAAAAAATGGAGRDIFADFGGVDPNMDPELAMALRVSMEEERARQQRLAAQQATQQQQQGSTAEESKDAEMTDATVSAMDMGLSEEEALLQQALAMSMNENEPKNSVEDDSKPAAEMAMDEDDEAAAMQLALQMSMQTEQGDNKEGGDQQVNDPQFVSQLLGSLPGVDPNDPAIKNALKNLKKDNDDDKKDSGKD
jgi:26S proteasome regulatory subunit N10